MFQQIVGKLPEVIWSSYGSNFRSRLLRVLAVTISSLWLWSKKQTVTYILYGLIVLYSNHTFQDIKQNKVGSVYVGAYLFNLFRIPDCVVNRFMTTGLTINTFSNYKYDPKSHAYTLELTRSDGDSTVITHLKHKLHLKDNPSTFKALLDTKST